MQGETSPGVADVVGGTFAGAAGVSALRLMNMGVMGQWGILRQRFSSLNGKITSW